VPIWFTFTRTELPTPVRIPSHSSFSLVQNTSSPVSWQRSPAGWLAQAIETELTAEEREVLARSADLIERLAAR
jgi:hypothetical protein